MHLDTHEAVIREDVQLLKGRSCHMSALAGERLFVLGGFDGWESLNEVEALVQSKNKFEEWPKMDSRVKNG